MKEHQEIKSRKHLMPRTFMQEVKRINKRIRDENLAKRESEGKDELVRQWQGEEVLFFQGSLTTLKSLTGVIGTPGCEWARRDLGGGCIFCGYLYDNPRNGGDPLKQIHSLKSKMKDSKKREIKTFKLYTSGSFLDEREISNKNQEKVVRELLKIFPNLKVLQVEARPEDLLKKNAFDPFRSLQDEIVTYFNIGLESANENILHLINKRLNFNVYQKAVETAKRNGFRIKTYLLLKPPFLTEQNAIVDAISSAKRAFQEGSDTISLNPLTVHSGTFVEYLWRRGLYRPPWPQSLIKVLQEVVKVIPKEHVIISEPVALGSPRGLHGTGKHTKVLKDTLTEIVRTQTSKPIPQDARPPWEEFMEKEGRDLAYSSVL